MGHTGESIRKRTISAGDREAFRAELEKTRALWKRAADINLHIVYEVGRDGFWIHRWLESLGIRNLVVDPARIEVNRRKRHLKTDSIDVDKLLRQLMRYHPGEHKLWSVLRVPTPEAEDEGRREREIKALKKERTMLNNRIKAHLFAQCCKPKTLRHLPQQIGAMLLCVELFGWRRFRNVREVGACAGLTGTAYNSGESRREQGISKAGNRRVRAVEPGVSAQAPERFDHLGSVPTHPTGGSFA